MTASFPDPHYVELPGLTMAVHQMGPADGQPILLCHGWPELAHAWHNQMEPLAETGYRVLAPDMRGYGQTGGPTGEGAVPLYDMEHLTGDLAHLCDALGLPPAIFVGHDWGGFVAWDMPLRHPDKVAGVIGVNSAYVPRPDIDPIELIKLVHGPDMYMLHFQPFGEAEKLLGHDTDRALRFLHRRMPALQTRAPKKRALNMLKSMERPETDWPGTPLHEPKDHAIYVEAYERTGWEGGLNWYRNLSRNWRQSEDLPKDIVVPCLMVFAENDVVLPPSSGAEMASYIQDLETHTIPNCGHWTPTEAPDALNELMLNWLSRNFS